MRRKRALRCGERLARPWTSEELREGESEAGELGFEPRQADPESAVLPLHHSPLGVAQPFTAVTAEF